MGIRSSLAKKARRALAKKNPSKRIDHLGLVAVKIKELRIIEFFEKKLPKLSQHKVTVGQVVAAMILIGLGYVHRALHLTPDFLKGWDLEKLIGPGVQAEHINDDVIGRALDAIYEAGPTELFLELLISILPVVSLGEDMRFHVDTTSISVYGQYKSDGEEEKEEEPRPIRITHGHSKDNHPVPKVRWFSSTQAVSPWIGLQSKRHTFLLQTP